MPRHDGRLPDQLRAWRFERGFPSAAAGSVLVHAGQTVVLCTASVSSSVPPWLAGKGRGWVTAEYNMLPGSTSPRKERKPDGRSTEIQRLVGRSLRAGVNLDALGERLVAIDCEVLRADGGTRTAAISGGWVALAEAVMAITDVDGARVFTPGSSPLEASVAAVSVGLVGGEAVVDLDYAEDSTAAVDMNVVMTGDGRFVEVQGGAEGATFSRDELDDLVSRGAEAIELLTNLQRTALGDFWPLG